jgi:acetyl esterase/lipase
MISHFKNAALIAIALLLIGISSGCSRLGVINALTPDGDATVTEGVSYGQGSRRVLDIYAPPNARGAPVVVFFYGGTWVTGSRTEYAFVGRALASRGMVAVVADYRLYPEVRYPEFLKDSAQAVAWTRREIARYGGDPARLFLMGHSAGAYNAAMLALDKRWLAAENMTPAMLSGWVGLAGPYDFIPLDNPYAQPVFFYPDTPPESQPIIHVSRAVPPTLLIAGRNDDIVDPVRNTGGLARKLRSQGVPVTEIQVDGIDHTKLLVSLAAPLRFLSPALDDVATFVAANKNKQASGAPVASAR